MIDEVLTVISRGASTPAELARELGIDTRRLKGRLEMLEHMGYIARCEEGEDGGGCALCPGKVSCGDGTVAESAYRLTEKGKRRTKGGIQ